MEDDNIYVYKQVESIIFGILSPKMIKKMASAKVVTPELYDKEGYPVDGGLMDIRLGVIDPGLRCRTCGSKLKECPGHFGYIELARPIIHIKFINLVMSLLQTTCRDCGRILLPQQTIDRYIDLLNQIGEEEGPEKRRKKVAEIIKSLKSVNKCPYCKAKQLKISLEKPTTVLEDDKRISPIEIRNRLEKIPDEDCEVFGLNPKNFRPEWAVLTIMSIPPVTMRPSITLESGERSEDDLTHKLGDIVRINQRLFENINAGAPEIIIEDLWDLLQYHITTFFDNNVAQLPPSRHRSGQPLKTLTERIKSKEGRIRHNLAGKRTNFSARTVISPDPMLGLNEVGVPEIIAMNLTVPERVTEWNMKYLKRFIENGPKDYPGANYIVRPDGKKKKITSETKESLLEELQPGYTVERHLLDGDVALFNRQPSLHKMSMMCHKVKVLPGKTFRINPAVCIPYNADFDGDEMNLHVPQTEESRAEAEILMQVQEQLISPRYGLSIIGLSQDAISGNFLLTKELSFKKSTAVDILYTIGIEKFTKLGKNDEVSGKDVFSCLLPDDYNFSGKSKTGEEIIIENGVLKTGIMDSANLGSGSGLLLRSLQKTYGPAKAIKIIGYMYKLGIFVLRQHGFSVSIADTDLPESGHARIEKALEEGENKANQLVKDFEEGNLEPLPGRSLRETLELYILEALNKTRDSAGDITKEEAKKDSHLMTLINSGAKGKLINVTQMSACVGQQALRGKRIEKGYSGRTLSHFKKNDFSPKAHGFIRHGFKNGMAPYEFFFMAMTGRDALMDTALRTPKSGYLYRRLANALQDLKVEYDGTVRDASKKVLQYQYGEDGIDVSKSENGQINIKKIIKQVADEK